MELEELEDSRIAELIVIRSPRYTTLLLDGGIGLFHMLKIRRFFQTLNKPRLKYHFYVDEQQLQNECSSLSLRRSDRIDPDKRAPWLEAYLHHDLFLLALVVEINHLPFCPSQFILSSSLRGSGSGISLSNLSFKIRKVYHL